MDIHNIASEIAKNNAGEQDAIRWYYSLISDTPGLPQAFYDDIHEIISDEMHHGLVLSNWVHKLTGIEAAKD